MRTDREPTTPAVRTKRGRGSSPLVFVRDVVVIFVVAVLVSLGVKTFLVRSFYIPSASMEQTLTIDDRILVNRLEPGLVPVSHGDVIVFRDPGGWLSPTAPSSTGNVITDAADALLKGMGIVPDDTNDHLIKRVIGLPGDHVVCCNASGQVTVNDVPLNETPYTHLSAGSFAASRVPFDVVVPRDSLWVMGDNRDNSEDSRYQQQTPGKGFVPLADVTGRAFVITWPISRWAFLDDYPTVFSGVRNASAAGR